MTDLRAKIFGNNAVKKHEICIDGLTVCVTEPTIAQAQDNSKVYFKEVNGKLETDNFASAFHYLINLVTDPKTGERLFTAEDLDQIKQSPEHSTISRLLVEVTRIARGLGGSLEDVKKNLETESL